jgi:hypothetical protein
MGIEAASYVYSRRGHREAGTGVRRGERSVLAAQLIKSEAEVED